MTCALLSPISHFGGEGVLGKAQKNVTVLSYREYVMENKQVMARVSRHGGVDNLYLFIDRKSIEKN